MLCWRVTGGSFHSLGHPPGPPGPGLVSRCYSVVREKGKTATKQADTRISKPPDKPSISKSKNDRTRLRHNQSNLYLVVRKLTMKLARSFLETSAFLVSICGMIT